MIEELRALVRVAEIDDSAKNLDDELKAIPVGIEETRQNVQKLETLLANERNQLSEAEALKKAQDSQVTDSNDRIAKAKSKGAKASNAKEAEAADRELDAVRRGLKDREDEQKRLADAIEKVRGSLENHHKEFEEFRSMFLEEEKAAKVRLAELEVERAKVLEGRDEIAKAVPTDILRRYDRIREKRGSGIAEVVAGNCGACRVQVLPQQAIVIQRGESIEQCHHCQRFLYVRPAAD
ncbi:MAG: hypothetical protein KC417_03695 [Myxococcales bacterium]|nr:hypothetical protein [Myxococcales bacterium]